MQYNKTTPTKNKKEIHVPFLFPPPSPSLPFSLPPPTLPATLPVPDPPALTAFPTSGQLSTLSIVADKGAGAGGCGCLDGIGCVFSAVVDVEVVVDKVNGRRAASGSGGGTRTTNGSSPSVSLVVII